MRILVIAPHADDEVIGVGGTIVRRVAEGDEVYVCVVTRGREPLFSDAFMQQLRAETNRCHEFLGIKKTYFLEFPSVMLEQEQRHEINAAILDVIREVSPDEVYIPHWGDMQKDHQIVAEAAMVAVRPKYAFAPKRIYAYETLSETGWNATNVQNAYIPNVYMDISGYLSQKLQAMQIYMSQVAEFPEARSLEAIEALAKYRGATMHVAAAEAFVLVREMR